MISDVLADATDEIRSYLDDPAFRGVYVGEARAKVEAALVAMAAARELLDTPPARGDAPLQGICGARSEHGFTCTLRGPHARHEAHGVRDMIATWPAVMP